MRSFPNSSVLLLGLPLALGLQGCSAGAVGLVLAILYAGGDGSGGVNLPPGQPLINAPLRIDGDQVLVTYFLQNDNGGPLDVAVEWQPGDGTGKDGTGAFYPAGRAQGILTEPNKPERAEFLWDARADLVKYLGRSVARVRIRVTASEGKMSSDPGLSDLFWAGNEAPVVKCRLPDGSGGCPPSSTGGILPFDLMLSDSSDDPVQLKVEYSNGCLEEGIWRPLTPLITKPETWFEASAAGKDLTFAWDSLKDVPHTESCDRVSVRFIPVDGLGEAGDPLVIGEIQVDNNADPEVRILEIAGIQDRSFEIPIRFNVSDGEGDRVSVILQWAERSAGFPPLPDDLDLEDRDFLKELLTSQDPESGFPSLRRDLHILSEAPILLKGTLDDSSDLPEDRSLSWIRETDFVRAGLYFCPLRGECSRTPAGLHSEGTVPRDFFLIGREIRLIRSDGDPGLTRRIVAFDPRSSEAQLDSPLPERIPPGTRYEVSVKAGLAGLASSPESVTHTFVWDSLKDLTESGTPLKSTIRLRATAVDSQRNPRPPPESVIEVESDFLIAGQGLYTGKLASSIAFGDVGDVSATNLQLSDVVVAIARPIDEVRIYWRRSTGELPLVPDRTLPAGGDPGSVALGDVSGDGRDEILVALKDRNSLRVFLQVGRPQDPFSDPPLDFPSGGTSPTSIALGDLNGDGLRDVAVTNSGSNTVRVYWSPLLDGGFQGSQDFATDSRAIAVAIGDVVGSDELCPNDLVVACRGGERGSVNVFARRGGSFVRTLHASGKSPSSIALGDFDGDGGADVAVTNNSSSSISVFRGNPTGLSSEPDLDLLAGSLPVSLAAGDINGDRKDDILVVSQGSAKLGVYIQGPDGLPARPFEEIPVGAGPTQVALGRNTVTRQVEAIVVHDGSEMADVHLQNFPGFVSLRSPLVLRTADSGTSFSVSMGDVDGDGLRDVAVASSPGDPGAGTLSIYLQSPTGNLLKVEPEFPAGRGPRSVAIGDIDGDGRNDVAAANLNANTVTLYRQDGGGTLAMIEPDLEAGPPPIDVDEQRDLSFMAIGDIDGDGRNDLDVANSASGTVTVFRQTEAGLEKAQDLTVGTKPGAVAILDVDGDGRNEVLAGFSNQIRIYRRGEGGLRVAGPDLSITSPNFINSLSIADLDGDGLNDIALTGSNENGALYFINDARGGFVPSPSSLPVGQHPSCVSLGDLNGDGWTDAVVASTNKELHLFMNSSGKFAASSDYKVGTGANPNWAIIGDLNGDGRNDVLAVLPQELLVYPAR